MIEVLREKHVNQCTIKIARGDITDCEVDAIVNAANANLQHGGGVALAIARKGGPIIQEESDRIGFVPVGNSALTTGGALKASFVIHTVGPRWGEGDEESKLRNAVRNTLSLAAGKDFGTIAMPAISAGIFGFPKAQCATIMIAEAVSFLRERETSLREIYFCLMDEDMIEYFIHNLDAMNSA
jgi:O-acetyl-ADP-ribose deacetylase